MGMTASFVQVSTDQLDELRREPDKAGALFMSKLGTFGMSPDCCDVDKAWHGVHFLLTGESWGGDGPAAWAVLGGTEIGEDMGYGPARYLTAEEVHSVAEALRPIDRDALSERFDADAMEEAGVYAFNREDADDEFEYFFSAFEQLKAYYLDAASNNAGMVLYMV